MDGERLIEEVRKFPVLYDQSDPKYRNAEYKERLWKIISDTLKPPGGLEECKKRWASIRDQFRRCLQKRKGKSGQSAAKLVKYKYEDILGFLLPHVVDRETLSNFPSLEDHREVSPCDPRMDEIEDDLESDNLQSHNEDSQNPGSSQTTRPHTLLVSETTPGKKCQFAKAQNPKRRLSNQESPAPESPSSQLMAYILAGKKAENDRNKSSNPLVLVHPVDIFLASLAPTLKSLDPVLLNQAKSKIFAIVQEFELRQILPGVTCRPDMDMMTQESFLPLTGPEIIENSSCTNSSHSSILHQSPNT